jgi:hypothetical protein
MVTCLVALNPTMWWQMACFSAAQRAGLPYNRKGLTRRSPDLVRNRPWHGCRICPGGSNRHSWPGSLASLRQIRCLAAG